MEDFVATRKRTNSEDAPVTTAARIARHDAAAAAAAGVLRQVPRPSGARQPATRGDCDATSPGTAAPSQLVGESVGSAPARWQCLRRRRRVLPAHRERQAGHPSVGNRRCRLIVHFQSADLQQTPTVARTFPDEAGQGVSEKSTDTPPPAPSVIDQQRFAATNIRKLEGIHLTLYTDVPSTPAVDELPKVFDLAIEPWCKYFRVDRKNVKSWKMTGYLMERRERFVDAGLLPADLPPFLNGYQRGGELWVYEQPSDYYRRHLLLHEGTHAFMQWQLKGAGPPWYMEGMAELMGTHRWQDGQLQLAYFPRDRQEVDHWGRIKMVRTEYDEGRGLSLEQIAAYGPTAHLRNEPYGWCWGASAFLDGHPDYSRRFRQLASHVRDSSSNFAAFFQKTYAGDRRQLDEQWQLFVVNLDYGYDLQREAIVYEPVATHNGDTVAGHDSRRPRMAVDGHPGSGRQQLPAAS